MSAASESSLALLREVQRYIQLHAQIEASRNKAASRLLAQSAEKLAQATMAMSREHRAQDRAAVGGET